MDDVADESVSSKFRFNFSIIRLVDPIPMPERSDRCAWVAVAGHQHDGPPSVVSRIVKMSQPHRPKRIAMCVSGHSVVFSFAIFLNEFLTF